MCTEVDTNRFLLLAEDRHGHGGHQQQTLSFGGEELRQKNIQHTQWDYFHKHINDG